MPDEQDFAINDPDQTVFDDTDLASGDVPAGDSGVLRVQPTDPNLLRITRDGPSVIIEFTRKDVPDEIGIAGYRDEVFKMLEQYPECTALVFDVAGIRLLPSGMLGLLASVKQRGRSVEILNPSPDVREALRITRLETLFTIRESQP